jgi:hypothetical protein
MSSGIPFKKKEDYEVQAAAPPKPEPPPDPHPDPVPEPEPGDSMKLNANDFKELISTVIAEARKPVKDERLMARIKRMREHNRAMQGDQREMLYSRFKNCNHMQLPGSVMTGCSCIAWATQSDGKRRGTCQHCGTIFSSERAECLNDEIWEAYKTLVRLPTHPAGNFNHVFQSA